MRRVMLVLTTSFAALSLLRATPAAAQNAPTVEALELRNLGLAQLENEDPVAGEETFTKLTTVLPADPLGWANLAVAQLRQQKNDAALRHADEALKRAPGRGDLLLVRAEVLAALGRSDEALAHYENAARRRQNDPAAVYTLYRYLSTVLDTGEQASTAHQALADWALDRLAALRPENLVVLMQRGLRALERGDRTVASTSFLRVRELLWQMPEHLLSPSEAVLGQLLTALDTNQLDQAKRPARLLDNVLKPSTMFKSSLVELFNPIQGVPVERFSREPPRAEWGEGLAVSFQREVLSTQAGSGLLVFDLDGDGNADPARTVGDTIEVRRSSTGSTTRLAAAGARQLLAVDLDNDGFLDLLAWGANTAPMLLRGEAGGAFTAAARPFGTTPWSSVAAIDFDSEGDLDLAVDTNAGLDLWLNTLEASMRPVGKNALPNVPGAPGSLLAADLDRDGDTDILLFGDRLVILRNLRQGQFAFVPVNRETRAATHAVARDLDNDGWPEITLAGANGLVVLHNNRGLFEEVWPSPEIPGPLHDVAVCDLDNDGRRDLATLSATTIRVALQRGTLLQPQWEFAAIAEANIDATELHCADADGDGDLDLFAAGKGGLWRFINHGGEKNRSLRVSLRGLTQGNDKNNRFGLGATLEVRRGGAYQYLEVDEPVSHFGVGQPCRVDLLRVVWANGVPQNRLSPCSEADLVEEQVLKGSCPFLYTWDGESVSFVTDLLWGAPLGMPVAAGVFAGADPHELVRIDGAAPVLGGPNSGSYDLRITEELWEAAYFDFVRLWVVDHPVGTEAASSLRAWSTTESHPQPDRVLLSSGVRSVAAAWDGQGKDVTASVARRDEVYAAGYPVGAYQGIAAVPWTFTFDLGEAPGRGVRLLLDGWVFPADASLNVASSQRRDLEFTFTRLEVEVSGRWKTLLDPMGFPAGKTKTMVIDTPPLPRGAHRLRFVTSRWLHWDRIAWTTELRDEEATVIAQLRPNSADLRYRGFSRLERRAPNAPHHFDYNEVSRELPWLRIAGPYTRYGDVRALLAEGDDRLVVLGAGDEMHLLFDAADLPAPQAGRQRTLFLESFGWDKDFDRNTFEATSAEPLPYRTMTRYPYGSSDYPTSRRLERWRKRWQTREQVGEPGQ